MVHFMNSSPTGIMPWSHNNWGRVHVWFMIVWCSALLNFFFTVQQINEWRLV